MSLVTERLGSTEGAPHTLEVDEYMLFESALLWHLWSNLQGLRVIAKKSWALTDDFEAFFLYRERLFIVHTPFSKVWVSLLGQPADHRLFAEVEAEVQSYGLTSALCAPIAVARFFFLPFNPTRAFLEQHGALNSRSES